MRSFVVLAAVVVVVAAKPAANFPWNQPVGRSGGQYAWIYDRSLEGSHDVSLEYVRPYSAVPTRGATRGERVKALSQTLNTGLIDLSDELLYHAYHGNLGDGNYYVDASGELYYRPSPAGAKPSGPGVQTAKK